MGTAVRDGSGLPLDVGATPESEARALTEGALGVGKALPLAEPPPEALPERPPLRVASPPLALGKADPEPAVPLGVAHRVSDAEALMVALPDSLFRAVPVGEMVNAPVSEGSGVDVRGAVGVGGAEKEGCATVGDAESEPRGEVEGASEDEALAALLPLRVCDAEPLVVALFEGVLLALAATLKETKPDAVALPEAHALPRGDRDALPLRVCVTDAVALPLLQPVPLPLTDARSPVLLEHEDAEGAREAESEPETLRENVDEGLPLPQGETLSGPLQVPSELRETLPVPLLVMRALDDPLPLGAPPLSVGKALPLNVPLELPGPRLGLLVTSTVPLVLPEGVREDSPTLAELQNVPLAEPLPLAPFDARALPLPLPEALVAGVVLRVGAPTLAVPGPPPLRDMVGDTRALADAEGGAEARLVAVGQGLTEGLGVGVPLRKGELEVLRASEGVGACEATVQLLAVALGELLTEVLPLERKLYPGASVEVVVIVVQGDAESPPLRDGAPLPEKEKEALPDELASTEAVLVVLGVPVTGTEGELTGVELRGAEGEGAPEKDTDGQPDAVVAIVSLWHGVALPACGVALPEARDETLLLPHDE